MRAHGRLLLLLAGLLLASALATGAAAQGDSEVPSVSLRPGAGSTSDPNDGTWFVAAAEPGAGVDMVVRISNPATVPQEVSLYLADLQVGRDGTPAIGARTAGLGAWGSFRTPTLVVPARADVEAAFSLTVPPGTAPGDHLGAVVAESKPQGEGAVRIVKRVANRLYVTVPGDARPGMELVDVDVRPERAVAPRWATVVVTLRNTGDVRLQPQVRVGGARAAGSSLLMSESEERYTVRKRVPFWGGPIDYAVEVRTRTDAGEGPAADGDGHALVLPVSLLLLLVLLVLGVLAWRQLPRRRRRRYDELEADVRQLREELREKR